MTVVLLVVGLMILISWAAAFFLRSVATAATVIFVVFVAIFIATIAGHRIKARIIARKSSRLVSSWVSQTPRD